MAKTFIFPSFTLKYHISFGSLSLNHEGVLNFGLAVRLNDKGLNKESSSEQKYFHWFFMIRMFGAFSVVELYQKLTFKEIYFLQF